MTDQKEKCRNVVAFWLMAVTQLSVRSALSTAAHDLLSFHSPQDRYRSGSATLRHFKNFPEKQCNGNSTGSIIAVCYMFNVLAASLMLVFCQRMMLIFKLFVMEAILLSGLGLIAYSNSLWALFGGTTCIGIALSVFELNIPPLTTVYKVPKQPKSTSLIFFIQGLISDSSHKCFRVGVRNCTDSRIGRVCLWQMAGSFTAASLLRIYVHECPRVCLLLNTAGPSQRNRRNQLYRGCNLASGSRTGA